MRLKSLIGKINIKKASRLRKIGLIIIAMGLILAFSANYFFKIAAAIEVLNGDGTFDNTADPFLGTPNGTMWNFVNVNTTNISTYALDTTNSISGKSAKIVSPAGKNKNYEAYFFHRFTVGSGQSASLDYSIRKYIYYGTGSNTPPSTYNVQARIGKVGGPFIVFTLDAGTTDLPFTSVTGLDVSSAITGAGDYELQLYVQGITPNGVGAYTETNFDNVFLNITVDTTPPTLVSASAVKDNEVNVLFSESVSDATALVAGNYQIKNTSNQVLNIQSVSRVDNRTIKLTTDTQTRGENYNVTVSNVQDMSGNTMSTATTSFTGLDTTRPTVISATATSPTTVNLVYSEEVEPISATTLSNYSVSGGSLSLTEAAMLDNKTVQLTTSAQTPLANYTLTINGVQDTASPANAIATNTTVSFSGYREYILPTLISASSTDNTNTHVSVTFSENMNSTALTAANYKIFETNTPANTIAVTAVSGSGATYTLTTAKQKDFMNYTLEVINVQDTSGNVIADDKVSNRATFVGNDSTPPGISSVTAPYNRLVRVVFNETVDQTSAQLKTNYSLSGGLTVNSVSLLADGKTVELVTSLQAAGTNYTLTIKNVKDLNNNAISATGITANFTGSATPPRSPHQNYKTDTTSCADCHNSHNSVVSKIVKATEKVTCMACHNQGGTSGLEAKHLTSTETGTHTFDVTNTNPPKNASCSGCHDPHGTLTSTRQLWSPFQAKTASTDPAQNFTLCYDCHNSTVAARPTATQSSNVFQYYSKATNTEGVDKGHFIQKPNTYKFTDGTYVPVDYQLNCTDCHDRHGSPNKKLLRTTVGTSSAVINIPYEPSNPNLTSAEEGAFCFGCHNGTNHLYNPADPTVIPAGDPTLAAAHTNPSGGCTGCHGGLPAHTKTQSNTAHAPAPVPVTDPESSGGQACLACHGSLAATSSPFHHYSNPNDVTYDGTEYKKDDTCLYCHVDHDLFRPSVNPANKRAANLRQFMDTVNGAHTPTDTDFIGKNSNPADPTYSLNGGVCISCHYKTVTERYTPNKTIIALSLLPTPTAADAAAQYDASAHDYNATSTYSKDNTIFYANCAKCHNDNIPKDATWQNSTYKFGTHGSDFQSILAPFNYATPTNPLEENFCYKCHGIAPLNPNGDAAHGKKDYYAGIVMSDYALGIYSQFTKASYDGTKLALTASRHPVDLTSNKHKANESTAPGWDATTNRHVECDDCHNSHQTKAGNTRDGSTWGADNTPFTADDTIPGVLTGMWGIQVDIGVEGVDYIPGAGFSQLSGKKLPKYTPTQNVSKVYELCLKCHSTYSWNTATDPIDGKSYYQSSTGAPDSKWPGTIIDTVTPSRTTKTPSAGSNGVNTSTNKPRQPDIAAQFHPSNYAFHPLFRVGLNQPDPAYWVGKAGLKNATYTDKFTGRTNVPNPNTGFDNTFVDGWGSQSLVTCTDCHANNEATAPRGPHGNANQWMLKTVDPNVTINSSNTLYSTIYTKRQSSGIPYYASLFNFCINCHRVDLYGTGSTGYKFSDIGATVYDTLGRFPHLATTPNGGSAPQQQNCDGGDNATFSGEAKGGNKIGTGCFNCHGSREAGGIHGSSLGVGVAGTTSTVGTRFINGASWAGYTKLTTAGGTSCYTSGKYSAWNDTSLNSCGQHTSVDPIKTNYDY